MEALNKKERNSAIIKFSLWLLICVLIICVPVIISAFVSSDQKTVKTGENEDLLKEISIEKEYFAVQIQKIIDLMKSKEDNEINADTFNAELMNVVTDIKKQTETDLSWRGDMYRNTVAIAEYLISANKIMSSSAGNREKQMSDLNNIILEFESCGDNLASLGDERKKRDIQSGVNDVNKQFKKALKMLNNFKSELK